MLIFIKLILGLWRSSFRNFLNLSLSITSKTGTKLNWINFVMLKVFGTLFSVNVRVHVRMRVCVCMYVSMYVCLFYLSMYLFESLFYPRI